MCKGFQKWTVKRCSRFMCKKDIQQEISVRRRLIKENTESLPVNQSGYDTQYSYVQHDPSFSLQRDPKTMERCEWQKYCYTPRKQSTVGSSSRTATESAKQNCRPGGMKTETIADTCLQHVAVPPEYCNEDIGKLVWGKFGRTGWWPAIIVPGPMAGMDDTGDTAAWVFWFGDRKISKVHTQRIKVFQDFYSTFVKKKGNPVYHQAVQEILMVCEERCGIDVKNEMGKSLKEWAGEKFPYPAGSEADIVGDLLLPNIGKPLPRFVADRLREIAGAKIKADKQGHSNKRKSQKKQKASHSSDQSCHPGESKSKTDNVKSHTCNNTECNMYNGQPLCQLGDQFKEYVGSNMNYPAEKRPIRVLSLFDGIATGKVVLDNLGIEVEVFYSCEIDDDATMVTSENHGKNVVQLGDVRHLTREKLCELGDIDLLIGGSPCNDFSRANPDRKGFSIDGTGILFFDFYRVFMELRTLAKTNGHHLFWLYENVASMSPEERNTLSRFLECDPAVWNAIFFTPQCRKRLFWGNIPSICRTPEERGLVPSVTLGSMLNENRVSKFEHLRCVTSKRNSILMGPKENILPVQVDGKDDGLTMDEIERIFGFPENYTDLEKLGVTRRHKLIGRSWCVPVVEKILCPLTLYFKSKTVSSKSVP